MSVRIHIPHRLIVATAIMCAAPPLYAASIPMDTPIRASSDAQANNNAQILQLIRDKFVSPTGSYRETVTTVLTVTVNSQGYVTNVSADSNNAHAQAAVNAIRAVGRFPIDSSDSKYPTFKIAFRGQN